MSTPKENVLEPPNFEQNQPSGYKQNHDGHVHDQNFTTLNVDQNFSYSHNQNISNTGQSIQSSQSNNQSGNTAQPDDQTPVQTTSSQDLVQNEPAPIKQETIPETKPEPSVFDLLSDIDFTVEQKPLMPQIKVPQISESAIVRPSIVPNVEPVMKPPTKEEVIERPAKKDPFSDPSLLNKFTQEVKSLQKYTDSLCNAAPGGLTVLDAKWKTFQDFQVSFFTQAFYFIYTDF